jgi:hypothetical protein
MASGIWLGGKVWRFLSPQFRVVASARKSQTA